MTLAARLRDFVSYASGLEGFEKGEAQSFCDRLFQAFGQPGLIEAGGKFEARIRRPGEASVRFADCLWSPPKRDGVLIEMKARKEKHLEAHFPQVRDYWIEMNPEAILGPGAQKPTYIILCNFDRFIVYRHLNKVDDFLLEDLESRSSALNFLLETPAEPIFSHNVENISEKTAGLVGELYKYLVASLNETPESAQRFILQCVVAMFSEDFELLPGDLFSQLINDCQKGASSYDLLGSLFRQMASPKRATGGRYKDVQYFNGGLFKKESAIELDDYSIDLLKDAANEQWKSVNPAIFGALFEGTLEKNQRHEFGAHFTNEADIQKIVNPTIIRPFREKIEKANSLNELKKIYDELESFVVLDPACGCGNFLFVSYLALKEVERDLIRKIASRFSGKAVQNVIRGGSRVSTRQFLGIDIQEMAVEVAKTTMMIAREIASDDWNNFVEELTFSMDLDFDPGLPLDNLDDCIVQGDALYMEWPVCDAIVGNPPFQSKNKLIIELGHHYVEQLRSNYPDIPGRADYCVYWFRKAHDHMKKGQRSGLVGTNTIRQNYSRMGSLDYILDNGGCITDAVSSQVWSGDAVVHVSIVNWVKGNAEKPVFLSKQIGDKQDSPFEFYELEVINSALSAKFDVSKAVSLRANTEEKVCFQGQTHGHKGFLLTVPEATEIAGKNLSEGECLHPYLSGRDELLGAVDRRPKRYVIDLNDRPDIFSVKSFPILYKILENSVHPDALRKAQAEKDSSSSSRARQQHYKTWWKFWRPRPAMLNKFKGISRYIACVRVTRRPIFDFVSTKIRPNDSLQVFALDDDYSFGILHSEAHWEWFCGRCSTLKSDWRYTSSSVFESFPWPQSPSASQVISVAEAAVNLRKVRNEIMAKYNISLREVYRILETNSSDPISEAQLRLDKSVAAAYGFTGDFDYLESLMELNKVCEQSENRGERVQGPGWPIGIDRMGFTSTDMIEMPPLV